MVFSLNAFTDLKAVERLMRTDQIADYPIPQENRIYIFEDIDAMGQLVRKRPEPGRHMDDSTVLEALLGKTRKCNTQNLAFLLNLIDGIIESQGRIILMTTNFVEDLDEALIRPGRIDLKLHFSRCTRREVLQILALFYDVPLSEIELPEKILERSITPARLTQICRANKKSLEAALREITTESSTLQAKANAQEPDKHVKVFSERNHWKMCDDNVCSMHMHSRCSDCQWKPKYQLLSTRKEDLSSNTRTLRTHTGARITINIKRNQ